MNQITISEIQIIPVKPKNGLVAFVSFIINESFFVSSVAVYTKLNNPDQYRLVYPSKQIGNKDTSLLYPIKKEAGAILKNRSRSNITNFLKNVMNMLDTVILKVAENDYKITKPDFFKPNASKLYEHGFVGTSFKNNYKTADKYYPRITITPRSRGKGLGTKRDLKIEFSVPKLIYGNNLQELTIFDEKFVYQFLYQSLLEMGVEIKSDLAKFEVSGFDTSKNIFLSKDCFSFQIIEELNKCTLDRRLDLDNKEYRESTGTTLQFYSKAHSFVIYDKLADLNKPNKRATNKDRNELQKDLFTKYSDSQKQEIIRFEVRLRSRAKVRQLLGTFGYKIDTLYFENLFNELLWKKILNYYWQSLIVDKNRFLFSKVNKTDLLVDKILKNNPEIKDNKVFQLIGINTLAKEKGLPELRKIYEKKLNGKNWSRFSKDFEKLNKITEIQDCFGWFEEVDRALRFDK
jgi:stage V sporulation protein G